MNKTERIHLDKEIRKWLKGLDEIIPQLITDMRTETKANQFDLVTNVDRIIQDKFEVFLQTYYPTHQLFAEEKIMI